MYPNSQPGARKPKLSAAGDIAGPPLPPRRRGAPALPPRIQPSTTVPSLPPRPQRYQKAEQYMSSVEDVALGLKSLHTNQDQVQPVEAQTQVASQQSASPFAT